MSRASAGRARVAVAIGFALMLLHSADEAFGHPEDGGTTNLAVGLVLGIVVVALYPRMTRGWRIGVLGLLGLNAVVQGVLGHLLAIVRGAGAPLDWTGVLFVAGGAVLLTLAAGELRHPVLSSTRAGDAATMS